YLVVDAHEDIAYNALSLGRDPRVSAQTMRAQETLNPANGSPTVGLPDFLAGNIRVVFGTIYVSKTSPTNILPKTYSTPGEAELLGQEQLAYYALLAGEPKVSIIVNREDLKEVIESVEPRLGIVLLMEGADPIVTPLDAHIWY